MPNLFTVPGDALAGYLLATGGVLGWPALAAAGAVLLIYCGGLLLNDYYDRQVDARERPQRPIPSGDVPARTVLVAGGLCLVAGAALACAAGHGGAGVTAAAVAFAAWAYDAGLKRVPWLGPAVMGCCRAGSVLVGGALGGAPLGMPVLAVAGITWAYTTALTALAAGEATGERVGRGALVPAGVLLAGGLGLLAVEMPEPAIGVLALAALGLGICQAGIAGQTAMRGAVPRPAFIGKLIRVMIPAQAAWSLWRVRPGTALPAVLLALFVALGVGAGLASRRFYGS
ncbi:MAG: UbiA family prenyltransferase [Candidatus Brocadiia bacterium]